MARYVTTVVIHHDAPMYSTARRRVRGMIEHSMLDVVSYKEHTVLDVGFHVEGDRYGDPHVRLLKGDAK